MSILDEMKAEEATIAGALEVLREAGEDGGNWMGYYAKGRHDPATFAYVCNRQYGHDDSEHRRHIRVAHVKHVWWRTVPIAGEPGQFRFMDAEPGARGAFLVTAADVDGWLFERRQAEQKTWEDQGRRYGVEAALRFCATRFGADYVDVVQEWNASRAVAQSPTACGSSENS